MPHDKNGNLLREGDIVTLTGKIIAVSASETACNVTVEAVERPDGESYIPTIAGNSRFYDKTDVRALKVQVGWAQNLFEGATKALGLPVEFSYLTCWEELLCHIADAAKTSIALDNREALAGRMYSAYCESVGGKAFNGDPLPSWDEFSKDPGKTKQADGWRAAASAI